MKKYLAMIAILTLTAGLLAGCGGSASSGTDSSGTSSAKESATESAPTETKAESKAKRYESLRLVLHRQDALLWTWYRTELHRSIQMV